MIAGSFTRRRAPDHNADFDRIQRWALANLPALVQEYGKVTLRRGDRFVHVIVPPVQIGAGAV
jgi:hypothetical protein